MKYLIFFTILVLLIIIAGCVGEQNETISRPTQIPQSTTLTIAKSSDTSSQINSTNPDFNDEQKKFNNSISALYLQKSDLSILNSKFQNENYEFAYCLFGEPYNKGAIITKMTEGIYENRTVSSVKFSCPEASIGSLHSHPGGGCILSQTDINSYNSQNHPVTGIICENNRLTFYTKENMQNFIPLFIVEKDDRNGMSIRDITPYSPCVGERYCNGDCWERCDTDAVFSCTYHGNHCRYYVFFYD